MTSAELVADGQQAVPRRLLQIDEVLSPVVGDEDVGPLSAATRLEVARRVDIRLPETARERVDVAREDPDLLEVADHRGEPTDRERPGPPIVGRHAITSSHASPGRDAI